MNIKQLRLAKQLRQYEVVFEVRRRGQHMSRASLISLEQGRTIRLTLSWLSVLKDIYEVDYNTLLEAIFAARSKNDRHEL